MSLTILAVESTLWRKSVRYANESVAKLIDAHIPFARLSDRYQRFVHSTGF